MKKRKELIVVGDRVLIALDKEQNTTEQGLYLPPGVKEKEKVHSGYVVKVGPGYPMPDPNLDDDEPWSPRSKQDIRYIPLQAQVGDYAIFLSNAAVEIEFEGKEYVVVPQHSILALVRDDIVDFDLEE